MACGEDHTLLLDSENNIWAFGINYNGQLGIGHNKGIENPEGINKFTNGNLKRIESEGDISFAISDNGEVFMWPIRDPKTGLTISIPRLINLPDKISNVACGGGFVLFLSNSGMLFSMGKTNTYGQLGHGDTKPRMKPTLVEIFSSNNERILQISCGYKHCIAKSSKNKAYSWGLVISSLQKLLKSLYLKN